MPDREQEIRERAYQLWEAEGRPEGRADEFWEQAAREVESSAATGYEADANDKGRQQIRARSR